MRIAGIIVISSSPWQVLAGLQDPRSSLQPDNKDYAGAKELPPLKAPPGLEAPNTRNALKVPPLQYPGARSRQERALPGHPAAVLDPQEPRTPQKPTSLRLL